MGDISKGNKTEEIITYIKENRVSTTEVADCLGKTGVIPGVFPLITGDFAVGEVRYVYTFSESNWDLHRQIENVDKGKIVFVDGISCNDRAIFGELVSKYLLLYRQSKAIVVDGKVRDAHRLIKERYSIWTKGVTPVGCFNSKPDTCPDEEFLKKRTDYYDGSVMVCDDSGVVVIPKEYHNETFLRKLHEIEEQEDIWFDCIDRRKWTTFETVCLKKYREGNQKE
ncbi:MAG: RraA family protein [Lachnospiraceae bacterium]|nr:RraA family protein [Lachnospiraceae bacterium]